MQITQPLTNHLAKLLKNSCLVVAFTLVLFFLMLGSSHAAWNAEIHVDGELIPAELIEGYQAHHNGIEDDCPPFSDVRDRDNLVKTWVRVKAAEIRGLKINDRDASHIAKLEAELESVRSQNDSQHRNRHYWLILSSKSDYYWRGHIGEVSDEEVKDEYERLVKNNDPRFVNAPFFRLMQMESFDRNTIQKLADRLHAGESWRQVSVDVDPLDWNSHHKKSWFTADRLDPYRSKAFRALDIDAKNLVRNDVIGPLSEVGRYRLMVILDATKVPLVPLDAKVVNSKKWAAGKVRGDIFQQRHHDLSSSLLEQVTVTQNNEPVTIKLKHEPCPG